MKFIKYAEHVNAPQYVIDWIDKVMTDEIDTTEGEHVIDYLVSEEAPKRLENANYKETKATADKWLKTQIKKGNDIKETSEDTEVVLDFNDGFKIVKLVGENAYKREGYLMSHCCASYFGREVEVFSLRDKDNMPHATMEKDQQIKGKGNGDIAPKYVDYVVKFLEYTGMTVGDSEMKHLGYVNVEKVMKSEPDLIFPDLYKGKYFNRQFLEKVEDKDRISLWNIFGLVSFSKSFKLNFNFDIDVSIKNFLVKTKNLTAVTNERYSTAVTNEHSSTAVANGRSSTAVANGRSSTAVANEHSSTAVANEHSSTAVTNERYSTAVTNEHSSTAVANEHSSTAVANGGSSTAVANRGYSTAVTNGGYSTAVANGGYSTAVTNEHYSTAVANEHSSTAVANGGYSTAVANGGYSTAVANGGYSTAVANEQDSVAVLSNANKSKIKAKIGSAIFLVERDKDNKIISVFSAIVDGEKIKEDVWYTLIGGELVEYKEEN